MGQIGSLTQDRRTLTSPQVWACSSAVEHLTFNQVVDGSIPSGLTTIFRPAPWQMPRGCGQAS